ncbi:acyl transferase/acyl hydrolase/lysophospholipase [Cadophora sp. MPI-SDFR-AT-0126]|nr:acyl transferase/acyl hydrolase/lysophospholipase [Leotiomycetes sp. MPI-SDFR-AT-0126]
MALCAHQYWLRVYQGENGVGMQHTNRLRHISTSLPDPVNQRPSILFFLGKQLKTRVLRALYPGNTISNCRKYGIANICLYPATQNDQHPILIADSCPDHTQAKLRGKDTCHETINHPVGWLDEGDQQKQQHLADHALARLFSLFIDVLCIFSQDCGGLDGVVDMLAGWTAIGSASSLPGAVRPRLVVVTSIPGDIFASEAIQFRLRVLSDRKFSESFSSLNVVNVLGRGRTPSREHFKGLAEALQHETHLTRAEKINSHTLFSMIHITQFFDAALRQFATSPQTFDFILCSRELCPVSHSFQHHLSIFTGLCSEHNIPANMIWDFIASVVIFDSFSPDMHMFNPSDVFRNLYRQSCVLGIHDFANSQHLDVDLITADIEAHIISMFSHMKYGGQSAAALRQRSLGRNFQHWSLLSHTSICLTCLQRNLEHHLECGHAICDDCLVAFGEPTKGAEVPARLLPPTCRVRFLGMDGGGSRGIISLAFMEELEKTLDLPYPLQEHFDYGIGTSSGGVATIGFFAKYWTPKQCLAFFLKFARIIFPPKRGCRYSICAILRRIFAFYLADGRYDAVVLEKALKETLGLGRVFDSAKSRPSGMKFAVTATTISDATLCLISNYNGNGPPGRDSRYKHLRAKKMTDEMLLWEAARCTTAAPTYFTPKYLESFGTFQDGGLKYNNPVRPGLREVRRIWGDVGCDLVLSIGTGYQQKLLSPVASNVRNLLQDGALARVYRASMQSLSLNGQLSWEDHWHGLDEEEKKRHFRLNLPLIGQEPRIDDVDKMQYLRDQIYHHLGDMEGIARAFKAASFFFELNGPLVFEGGQYTCHGSILSRSPDSRALVQSLRTSYPFAQFLHQESSLGFLAPNDLCELCGRFQKLIKFHIRHPSDRVNLQFSFSRLFRRSISGFPQPMEWFVKRQKLDAKFGLPDHRSRNERAQNLACSCELMRYLDRSVKLSENKRPLGVQTRTQNKRRRLR